MLGTDCTKLIFKPTQQFGKESHTMIHSAGIEVETWMWVYHLLILLAGTMLVFGLFWQNAREWKSLEHKMPGWMAFLYEVAVIVGMVWTWPVFGGVGTVILTAFMLGMGAPVGAAVVTIAFSVLCWWLMGMCIVGHNRVRTSPSW